MRDRLRNVNSDHVRENTKLSGLKIGHSTLTTLMRHGCQVPYSRGWFLRPLNRGASVPMVEGGILPKVVDSVAAPGLTGQLKHEHIVGSSAGAGFLVRDARPHAKVGRWAI